MGSTSVGHSGSAAHRWASVGGFSAWLMGCVSQRTALAALSLALGIGANTAIYSFMDAILMRALPVEHPEALALVQYHTKDFPAIAHGPDAYAPIRCVLLSYPPLDASG